MCLFLRKALARSPVNPSSSLPPSHSFALLPLSLSHSLARSLSPSISLSPSLALTPSLSFPRSLVHEPPSHVAPLSLWFSPPSLCPSPLPTRPTAVLSHPRAHNSRSPSLALSSSPPPTLVPRRSNQRSRTANYPFPCFLLWGEPLVPMRDAPLLVALTRHPPLPRLPCRARVRARAHSLTFSVSAKSPRGSSGVSTVAKSSTRRSREPSGILFSAFARARTRGLHLTCSSINISI